MPQSPMSKEELKLGLIQGRILDQWDFANHMERRWVEELIEEGIAKAGPWVRRRGRLMRKVMKNDLS